MEDTKQNIVVLDGGFATQLERIGFNINEDPLWSARLLHSNPSAVVDVHKSYLASGSTIITTASYQASISGFQQHLGITEKQSIDLLKSSVELAKQARREHLETSFGKGHEVLIAGSIGPYGAFLADGSEYSGDYCDHMSHEDLLAWHRPRLQYLLEAGVDLIAMETIPAAKEGETLMKLLHDFPEAKTWLSFSCQSLHETAHRERIGSTVKNCMKIAPAGQLIAIGVNCCPPQYVQSLLQDIAKEAPGFPLIAYPNSGETFVSKVGWKENKEKPIHTYIDGWIDTSVKYIGGCCRTGPEDIAQIVEHIKHRK